MKIYITNQMKLNASKQIIIELLNNNLISLDEFTLIIKRLEQVFSPKKSNEKKQ